MEAVDLRLHEDSPAQPTGTLLAAVAGCTEPAAASPAIEQLSGSSTEADGIVRSPFRMGHISARPVKACSRAASDRKAGITQRAASRSSRFKGVTKRKGDRWMAYLYCRGRQHNSREFHDELEAARWYDAKASELLGAAAVLNFPQETTSSSPYHSLEPVPEGHVVESAAAALTKGLPLGRLSLGQLNRAAKLAPAIKNSKANHARGSRPPAIQLLPQGMLPLFQGQTEAIPASFHLTALQDHKATAPSKGFSEVQQADSAGARAEAASNPDYTNDDQSRRENGEVPVRGVESKPRPRPCSDSMIILTEASGHSYDGVHTTPCHGSLDFLAAAAAEVAGCGDQPARQFKDSAVPHNGLLARDSGDKSWLTRSSRSAFTSVSKRCPPTAAQPNQAGHRLVHSSDSAQPRPADCGSLRPCGAHIEQEQRTLSSCSGSTVSLNVRPDSSETQSVRVQQDSALEIPRWGAKRRATSRCASAQVEPGLQAASSPSSATEVQQAVADSRGAVAFPVKPEWMPATPFRQHLAVSGPEQQPLTSTSLPVLAGLEHPQLPRQTQSSHGSERKEAVRPAPPVSQQVLPTFSGDPTERRAAFTAWRCSAVEKRLLETFKQQESATSVTNPSPQPLLASLQAWSAQEAILRPAATSALQLAPPSLPQALPNTHHHLTDLKPFWSQPQHGPSSRQWPAGLPSQEAQPASTGAAAAAGPSAWDHSQTPLPRHPSAAQHAHPLSPPPSAASPWGRSSSTSCHPAQLSGLGQAAPHVQGHAFPQGFPQSKAQPARSPQGFPQPSCQGYLPQAGQAAVHAANASFLAHCSSAENAFLTSFPNPHQNPHASASLHSYHEAARGCLPGSGGQWPLPTRSPPSVIPSGFPIGRSACHLSGLGTRKRKDFPGSCQDAMPSLAGTPFAPSHAGHIPTAAGCHSLQPPSLDHAMGAGFSLPPHLQAGPPNAMAPRFPQPHPSMSPPMLPRYPPMCIPHGFNPGAMGPHSQQSPLGGLAPNGMFQANGDPSPEEQRRLHEDVQAHLRAGHELLQALQCPSELPGMGLADLTNRANMSVSLSAGLPPLAGGPAVGTHQLGLGPVGHCLLSGGAASRATASGCLEELQQQLSRPDLTAAIKGLGTASLGATLLLKAALQKQAAGSS